MAGRLPGEARRHRTNNSTAVQRSTNAVREWSPRCRQMSDRWAPTTVAHRSGEACTTNPRTPIALQWHRNSHVEAGERLPAKSESGSALKCNRRESHCNEAKAAEPKQSGIPEATTPLMIAMPRQPRACSISLVRMHTGVHHATPRDKADWPNSKNVKERTMDLREWSAASLFPGINSSKATTTCHGRWGVDGCRSSAEA